MLTLFTNSTTKDPRDAVRCLERMALLAVDQPPDPDLNGSTQKVFRRKVEAMSLQQYATRYYRVVSVGVENWAPAAREDGEPN